MGLFEKQAIPIQRKASKSGRRGCPFDCQILRLRADDRQRHRIVEDPQGSVTAGEGHTVAILNRNEAAFHFVKDDVLLIMAVAAGKRNPGNIYDKAKKP